MKPYLHHNLSHSLYRCLVVLTVMLAAMLPSSVDAATLPSGFTETQVASGMSNPTAMTFAPDGRLFVLQQGGQVRVIKNNTLLATPFLTVPVNSSGERGLLGIAFDPNFAQNQFVYLYYTVATTPIHNRVSRFTANGDVAVAGTEVVILDLENLSSATNHNGGAIHFGPDGKLYIAVGENANASNAQTLTNRLGKMLRINADGSLPTDNPFHTTATGANRAIWSLGLRNPFTFSFQPGTGRMFINDVGQSSWEEINEGSAGANYGWPATEGYTNDPTYRSPIYAYENAGSNCAITGGAFYNPVTTQFPNDYVGDYFFADYCGNWIKRLDATTGSVTDFASGISRPVDLAVAADGSLYYLARGEGAVFKVQSTTTPTDLIVNGGFELDTAPADGKPDSWSSNSHVYRYGQLKHSGSYSMLHWATADSTYLVYQGIPNLQPGTSHTVGGWVNVLPTSDISLQFHLLVQWRDAGNVTLRTDVVKSYTAPTNGWNQASGTFVAPPRTAYALVILLPVSLKGAILVDDVTFER